MFLKSSLKLKFSFLKITGLPRCCIKILMDFWNLYYLWSTISKKCQSFTFHINQKQLGLIFLFGPGNSTKALCYVFVFSSNSRKTF